MYATKKVHASSIRDVILPKTNQRRGIPTSPRKTGTLGTHLIRLKASMPTFMRRRDRLSQSGSTGTCSTDDSSFRDHNRFLSCETGQTEDTRDDTEECSSPISIVTVKSEQLEEDRDDDSNHFPLTETSSHIADLSPSSRSNHPSRSISEPILQSRAILRKPSYGNNQKYHKKNSTAKIKRSSSTASFSTLEIREYHITLGDNPGGYQGPPISLDWSHDSTKTIRLPIDEYELNRMPRRDENDMYLPECLRRWKLLEKGVSMKEMRKATKTAECTRRQRRNTIEGFKQVPTRGSGYLSGLKTKLERVDRKR